MKIEKFEKVFNQFLNCVKVLQKALNVSFGEALTETFDNLENGKIKVELGAPDQETVRELSDLYADLDYDHLSRQIKVQVFTYLVLKAINDDDRDVNQMPTPMAISTVIALFMRKLLPQQKLEIVDPAIGTGTLLYAVINQLKETSNSHVTFQLAGLDNDESMLDFADIAAHLNQLKIDLYCQDALLPWMVQADAVVSDLPVGYYPLDDNARHFANRAHKGHSLAHLLYIEQIIKNLTPAGYAFLVVPTGILSGKGGANFMPWLAKKVYLRAIVGLPDEMFKNKFNQKSILVFQNHGGQAKASEVLLTKLASFKNESALIKFNVKLNEWYTKSIG